MSKKINFTVEQKEQIRQALADHVKISNLETQNAFIEQIENTGAVNAFGAGSLLEYSHLQNADKTFIDDIESMFSGLKKQDIIEVTPAPLEGYSKDFVCFDIHYRGTDESPGITIGIEKSEGASTPGGVLKTSIEHLDSNVAANFISYYMEKFADREMPPNMPIYTFDFLPVTTEVGETVIVLSCVADTEGPLYIHNPNNRFAQKDASYYIERDDEQRKAQIIGTAMGNPQKSDGSLKPQGSVTDLDYLRGVIKSSIEQGVEVETRFHRLYASAVIERAKLSREVRAGLEHYEKIGIDSNSPQLLSDFMVSVGEHNARVAANDPKSNHEERQCSPN
ncbi:MAG: hypothetical protein DHS20C02_14810 [Micavibrio sp.]|nr:MAG: hypothetical protein DHS20C02_14810 [Micavibrio sp.]